MITYAKVKQRHVFSMNNRDLSDLAELVYLLKHTPPPAGFNRRPFTTAQQRVVDQLSDLIGYPSDYGTMLNNKTGQ